jgi:hypothetical protein
VNWVNKAGAGRFAFKEAASKNDLRSFAAQMKSTVRVAGGSRPACEQCADDAEEEGRPAVRFCDIDFEVDRKGAALVTEGAR